MEHEKFESIASQCITSYLETNEGHRIGNNISPSLLDVEEFIKLLMDISYPGFFSTKYQNASELTAVTLHKIKRLSEFIQKFLNSTKASERQIVSNNSLVEIFLEKLAVVRTVLLLDLRAVIDGDPAATSIDEVVLVYPGLLAITVHRYAHELHVLGIPLIPRMMGHWAHRETGIDIHPAAVIGSGLFIDHGTGVVIGETTVIGENVKLYQGVTLGALSFPRDEQGVFSTAMKRHPTIGSNVIIYANATVLGGKTIVSANSIIGASVFLSKSVPSGTIVRKEKPLLSFSSRPFDG